MLSVDVADFVEDQAWIGPFADRLSETVKAGVDTLPKNLTQPVKNVLHGTFLGHPLHPAVTDVPLGAWSVAAVLDTAEMFGVKNLSDGADAAVAVGLMGALASAVTGLADWNVVDDEKPKKLGAVHGLLNVGATVLYTASWLLRKGGHRRTGRILAGAGFGLVGVSAYIGGMLVFDEKIGVDHAQRDGLPDGWTTVIDADTLEENKPVCVKAGAVEVVLVKSNGKIDALGNLCSHLGGPLCEGNVEDGTIVCPWHASRFELATGSVIDGPAVFPQPTYKTRIVDGKVEVEAG